MPNPGSCLCVRVGGERGGWGEGRVGGGKKSVKSWGKKFDDECPGGLFELRY